MISFGATKVYGKIVSLDELQHAISEGSPKDDGGSAGNGKKKGAAKQSQKTSEAPKETQFVHVRAFEYQGHIYSVSGLCLIFIEVEKEKVTAKETPLRLLYRNDWPHDADKCWEVGNDQKVIRMDSYVGTVFDVLIDPELGSSIRGAQGNVGERGRIVGGEAGLESIERMSRIHYGTRLIE